MDILSVGLWFFLMFLKYVLYLGIFLAWKVIWFIAGPFVMWLHTQEPQNNKSFKANWKEGSLLMLTGLTEEFLRFKISKNIAWYKYGENMYVNKKQTYGRMFAMVIDNDMKPLAFRFLFAKKLWKERFFKCDFGWRLNRLDRGQKSCGFIFSLRFMKGL